MAVRAAAPVAVAVTVAVIGVPVGRPALARTTTLRVADDPAPRVAAVAVTDPVLLPTGGRSRVNVVPVPPLCVADTKVVFAGVGSVTFTAWAAPGPPLLTVTV